MTHGKQSQAFHQCYKNIQLAKQSSTAYSNQGIDFIPPPKVHNLSQQAKAEWLMFNGQRGFDFQGSMLFHRFKLQERFPLTDDGVKGPKYNPL